MGTIVAEVSWPFRMGTLGLGNLWFVRCAKSQQARFETNLNFIVFIRARKGLSTILGTLMTPNEQIFGQTREIFTTTNKQRHKELQMLGSMIGLFWKFAALILILTVRYLQFEQNHK